MKCYYIHTKDLGKVLIPICWSVVMSQDIIDCTCTQNPHIEYMNQLKSEGKIEQLKEYRKIFNKLKNDRK